MGQGQVTASSQAAAEYGSDFASAHQALRADKAVQFNLTPADPPPKPPQWLKDFIDWLNEVLKPVGRFFDWIGQFMPDSAVLRYLVWALVAAVAIALVVMIYQRLRHGEWRLPWRRGEQLAVLPPEEDEWRPEAAPVRSWLEEADALAAKGRFAEAIHHLLLRSIEDIARRRPRLVRPALTSRELAASDGIPSAARDLFASIARLVERSLFGGREVGQADWDSARGAYADFALAKAWTA
jgi:hypothetical protein